MGKIVALYNDTAKAIHIGNKMIRPGDTREVDSDLVPFKHYDKCSPRPDGKPKAPTLVAPPQQDDDTQLLSLLDNSINDIKGKLPGLTVAQLEKLEAAEGAKAKPRKNLMEAFAEDRLNRAQEATETDELVALLQTMGDEELIAQLDVFQGDEGKIALVNAEIERRHEQAVNAAE